jgi:hypothetical protein
MTKRRPSPYAQRMADILVEKLHDIRVAAASLSIALIRKVKHKEDLDLLLKALEEYDQLVSGKPPPSSNG